ncbi:MAG TPA: maleylpyruvate isomerase family mycothiol-dependent enzyme [Streptosporangiaceae bacterium]
MDAETSQWMADLAAATGRLLGTAGALTDAGVREPSLLPGWTRGHVLTHIARNADGLANLLRWAQTGIETPMYASAEARAAAIEAGAGRPAAELAADVAAAADAFAGQATGLPAQAWTAQVRRLTGPPFPAYGVLQLRLSEVEIHHVDLAAGYRPGDWPDDFVTDALARVADSFAGRQDTPACVVWAAGSGARFRIGPDRPAAAPTLVHGPAATLLAWLTGRDGGSGLQVFGDDPTLPVPPAWR